MTTSRTAATSPTVTASPKAVTNATVTTPVVVAQFRASAESETSRLQQGPTVSILGDAVPKRVLIALGVFVVVFTVVYLALFGLLGGLGLALGWIPAAAIAFLAIQLVGRSGGTQGEPS